MIFTSLSGPVERVTGPGTFDTDDAFPHVAGVHPGTSPVAAPMGGFRGLFSSRTVSPDGVSPGCPTRTAAVQPGEPRQPVTS